MVSRNALSAQSGTSSLCMGPIGDKDTLPQAVMCLNLRALMGIKPFRADQAAVMCVFLVARLGQEHGSKSLDLKAEQDTLCEA